jgi:hypothetical protein
MCMYNVALVELNVMDRFLFQLKSGPNSIKALHIERLWVTRSFIGTYLSKDVKDR